MTIDWDRLTPAQRAAVDSLEIRGLTRSANLDSLKMIKALRRSIARDAELNGFKPQGLADLDKMIDRLVRRLRGEDV